MNNLDTWIKKGFEHYLAKDFERLDNIHYGRIGVIIGNGSSAKGFDYSILKHPAIVSFAIEEAGCELEKFSPDFWVFNSIVFADRIAGDMNTLNTSMDASVIMNKRFLDHGPFSENYPKELPHQVYVFQSNATWNRIEGETFREDSSVALALYAAWESGIRKIILVGIDACDIAGEDYDPGSDLNDICLEYEDMRIDYGQIQVIEELTEAKAAFDNSGREYEIYQTSTRSPISCFEKRGVRECLIGWDIERRSNKEMEKEEFSSC